MMTKELKLINENDDINKIIEYIYKKQLNIHSSCCICPKKFIEIKGFIEKIINHCNDFIIAVYSNKELKGVGCFLYEPSDKYLESIGLFVNENSDIELIINYLKLNYMGNKIDFVFPPENNRIINFLKKINAKFELLQICFEINLNNFVMINGNCKIIELNNEYFESYRKIHNDEDVYWTSDRIINSQKLFKVFLAINNNEVIGYVDITYGKILNEIYSLYVIKEYADKYFKELLCKSICNVLSENNNVMILLNKNDNNIKILKKIGFIEIDKRQTITLNI